MSHTAFLNVLAVVCEATERIPIPRYPPPPNCYSGYTETSGTTEAMVPYQPSILYYHQPEYALPSHYYSSPSPLQNTRVFQQFLDDTWPEETLRRGSAVIRNKLYEKIVETLQGGEATAYSEGNPVKAICSRGDLQTKPSAGGCIDTKVIMRSRLYACALIGILRCDTQTVL